MCTSHNEMNDMQQDWNHIKTIENLRSFPIFLEISLVILVYPSSNQKQNEKRISAKKKKSFYVYFLVLASVFTSTCPAMRIITVVAILVGVVNALQPQLHWNPGKAIARQKKSDLQRVDITNEISLVLNEPFTKLMELCPNVGASTSAVQWMQRELTEEWVKEFELDLQAVYDKCVDNNKIFSPYLGEIFVGKLNGSYFVLDGQHRYVAFKNFHLKYEGKVPFSVPYKLQEFAAATEMIECFGRINKQRSLSDDVKEGLFTDTRSVLINHLLSKYGKHISKSEKPQFPNIHVDTIVPEIMRRLGDEKDPQRIIEKFEDLNKGAGETLQSIGGGIDHEKAKNKQGLYIGVWRSSKLTNARRNSIPTAVRNQLFQKNFGHTTTVGECFCCKVQYRNCDCGPL